MTDRQWVAIVDDDELFRKALARVFNAAGFLVESFADAESFLSQYIPKEEACLILDLRMPRIGGLELQTLLSRRGIDLPVIICTGNADVPVAVQAMQTGAFSVIEKPISNELLVEEVRRAIASTRTRRARRVRIGAARARLALLTERELQVARHLADGLRGPELASLLGIRPRTIDAHRMNLFRKLEINSSAALARLFAVAEIEEH